MPTNAIAESFSNQEARISLLDARAGSPPFAAELIRRQGRNPSRLETQLAQWEEWAAEFLETHLAYPMLAYFPSQHTNQSWLAGLTSIIDASVLVVVASDGDLKHQDELTFAMGRHALLDLATIFKTPHQADENRLSTEVLGQLRSVISTTSTRLRPERLSEDKLNNFREMYGPYANALGRHSLMALPPWMPTSGSLDNWQTTSWGSIGSPFTVSDPFLIDSGENEG